MAREVIATLNALIAEKNLLKHPFYEAWTAGELPIERLRDYAIRYYPHVAAFPRYLSAIHSRCDDIATRQAVLENLIEEERGMAFFRVHEQADVWHSQADAELIEKHCVSEADAAGAIEAGLRALDVLWSALDSM